MKIRLPRETLPSRGDGAPARPMRAVFVFVLLIPVLLLQGCQTTQPTFATPDARWQTFIGQLQYASPKRSIIGDCVVSVYKDQQFQLDFMAGPGFPLLKLRIAGNLARADGAFAMFPWQGKTDFPPARLESWVATRE